MALHPANDRTPDVYASDHLSSLASRWNGALGSAVRRFAPLAWPGTPPEALVAFTVIGSQREDTADTGNSFHEMGYFQTEGGPASGPAPNPDPRASNNRWGQLAGDATVRAMLGGRPATMVPGAWKDAVDDQAAVGLVNLARYAGEVGAGLPAGLAAQSGSLWRAALAFTGFSAGTGGARRAIARYASALQGVPEPLRFAAWVDAILRDAAAGTLPGPAGEHGNPAYDALRTWQKLASGRMLAARTGGFVGWFDTGFGANEAAAQRALTDAAYRRSVSGSVGFSGSSGAGLGALLLAVGAGGLAWWYYGPRRRSRRAGGQ